MTDLLKELCTLDGVSGSEDSVRDYIRTHAEKYADSVETDAMGNLIATKKGAKSIDKTLMLTAHMDEAGIMVTHITDDGYVKFACVGEIDRRVLIGKEIYIGESRVYGVIGNKAIHLVKADERSKITKTDDMYIDIGASSKEKAEELVSVGDIGCFDNSAIEYGGNMLKGKGIGGRAGCAVLLKLLEQDLPINCCFAFTVQSEVGARGIHGAAFKIKPDIALNLCGAPSADMPSISGAKKICVPDSGVVIPFMDKDTIYDKQLYKTLCEEADRHEIKRQEKSVIIGKTESAVLQRSGCGAKTAEIAVAVRNPNSPASAVSLADVNEMYRLSKYFIERIGEEN